MKRIFTLAFFAAILSSVSFAQCTINTGITTNGFTPSSLPCIPQGATYGQAVQVRVPSTQPAGPVTVNIDSVKLLSVTGLPAGIVASGVPASGVIHGGGNGCLWYSGITNAAVANYPLGFNVRVWASYMGVSTGPKDTTLASFGYTYSLNVCLGTGLNELQLIQSSNIYPNPTSGIFTLNFITAEAEQAQVKIYDLMGRLVQTEEPVKVAGYYSKQIDLSHVAKGLYIVQIKVGKEIENRRIEVQ